MSAAAAMIRHGRNVHDRGAAAVLIAISMLTLMGFAAIAVDIGLAMNERRQDQSAADVGALAAVQFARPESGCSRAACVTQAATNGANEAMTVANNSLDDPSAAAWLDASKCASPPAGFSVSPVTNCVAFTNNFGRAWVRIPTIASPTFFGRLLGANSISISAYAIADHGFKNPGPVWPFLLPGNAAAETYNCLKTAGNPTWGACEDLPSTGNFGSMDFFLFGDVDRNTTPRCNGQRIQRMISNIARGIDHSLGIHPSGVGSGFVEDQVCAIVGALPDMAPGEPGVAAALEAGLLYGGSSYSLNGTPYPGLLEGSFPVRLAGPGKPEARIDDTFLWTYLISDLGGSCDKGTVDTPGEMIICINDAMSGGTIIFDGDIINSPRFGFTPAVYEFDFLTPGQDYHISGYQAVYADTTYYGCSASRCEISHTPGVPDTGACPPLAEFLTCGTAGAWVNGLNALTAYILDESILPSAASEPGAGSSGQRFFNLSE